MATPLHNARPIDRAQLAKFHMDPDFDRFEKKVDEIERLVRGLCSRDGDEASQAERDADAYLKGSDGDDADEESDEEEDVKVKKKFDKTVINKQPDTYDNTSQMQSPGAFMAHVERDARERAEARRRRAAVAAVHRGAGDEAFAQGDFADALHHYTQAIDEVKDSAVLYVNRAVTYLKLGLFRRMLDDCEWALKANDKCLRAWLLKARAHFELDDEPRADECLREALARNPHRKRDIDAYAAQWRWSKAESKHGSL